MSIVGQVTVSDQVDPVNVVLMDGKMPVSTDGCGKHLKYKEPHHMNTFLCPEQKSSNIIIVLQPR